MILKAKHNFFLDPFFRFYVIWKMKQSFYSTEINGKLEDKNQPVLLLCNHISWWDGIWTLYLNQQLFKRKYHFMMLEKQLRKNWFFNYTGGYSVNPGSKTIIETVNYTVELLQKQSNLVLLFPQGSIQSMHKSTFQFSKGVESILKKLQNPVQVVFVVNLIDYFSHSKPTLNITVNEHLGEAHLQALEDSYNRFYNQCINTQIKKVS